MSQGDEPMNLWPGASKIDLGMGRINGSYHMTANSVLSQFSERMTFFRNDDFNTCPIFSRNWFYSS